MEKRLTVIHYPIVHTEAETGIDAKHRVTDVLSAEFTRPLWAAIRADIGKRNLDLTRVNVYQDGLPDDMDEVIGGPLSTVGEFMPSGPNADMLRFLVTQGAKLIGTENRQLISRALLHRHHSLEAENEGDSRFASHHFREFLKLLRLRDQVIAGRIKATLTVSQTGILFLGGSHDIKPYSKGLTLVTSSKVNQEASKVTQRYERLI